MPEASTAANAVVRQAFLKIDPATTLTTVDALDLRAHAKVSPVVGVPLRQLQQRRDVNAFATTAPILALKGLLELMATPTLERIIELLGDHADAPTFEQMAAAVDELSASGTTNDDIVALLAFAIGESFPAAPHCRRLFEEREELALPPLPDIAAPSVLAPPREVSQEVREQRKARREEEKRKKKTAPVTRPPRPAKVKAAPAKPVVAKPEATVEPLVPVERRPIKFTPLESSRFDIDHALVGSVILVDVPYDATDVDEPEIKAKERPALVVGVADDAFLVRPLYSNDAPTRQVFQAWRRLGLDHVSYIDDGRVIVARVTTVSTRPLGQVTASEWNALH